MAGLVQATDGNFYGTAAGWRCQQEGGCGTVFKITLAAALTTLYSFCSQSGCADGEYPGGALIQGTDGNFYGTTAMEALTTAMGASSAAERFSRLRPGGTLTTLHSFCTHTTAATDGAAPHRARPRQRWRFLRHNGSGAGQCRARTVFKIQHSMAVLTTLYNFCSQRQLLGRQSIPGLVQDTNGGFYGTTTRRDGDAFTGCGTVFGLSVGLRPFVETRTIFGKMGAAVKILGTTLTKRDQRHVQRYGGHIHGRIALPDHDHRTRRRHHRHRPSGHARRHAFEQRALPGDSVRRWHRHSCLCKWREVGTRAQGRKTKPVAGNKRLSAATIFISIRGPIGPK